MQQHLNLWIAGLVGLVIALLISAILILPADAPSGPLTIYVISGTFVFLLAALAMRWMLVRDVARPLDAISRDVRTLLQAKRIDRSLRIPVRHRLGGLPESIIRLIDELRGARHEVVRAMASATARVEQEKGWLEVILLELVREGVIVCRADGRILLYNRPAAQLLRFSHALGLGRSLFGLIAPEPIAHALEQLNYRMQQGSADLNTRFVCATRDTQHLLQARLALIIDPDGKSGGYVLTLEDISAELAELQRNETIRRAVTRELRGPVASLRAAAENMAMYPDMDTEQRSAFVDILSKESTILSERIEALANHYQGNAVGHWPMTEIHSPDLFGCLGRLIGTRETITLDHRGEPQWLKGDSHSLMQVLAYIIDRIAEHTGVSRFEISAGVGRTRTYIELNWQGPAIASATLTDWLAQPLPSLPAITAHEIFERHGSEPWSQADTQGQAILRIPLQPPSEPISHEQGVLPPRPEFYDFDLMHGHDISAELAERPLRQLSFVVFDTETTGLKPAGGDEIISIAAVRVTGGRVMSGEIFEALVNPGRSIPKDSIQFHGITDDQVKGKPSIIEVLPRFREFAGDAVLVAHNAAFDMKFIKLKENAAGVKFDNPVMDTLLLSLLIEGDDEDHSLDGICDRLNITVENRHSALGDTVATAEVLVHFLDRLDALELRTFGQVMRASNMEASLRFRAANF